MLKSDFIFNEPGNSDRDSLPIGNGDIGAMVWGEENGKVCLYISKTDSFSSALRLLKIGRVDINLDGGVFSFISQKLDIQNGLVTIEYGNGSGLTSVQIWVDAHNPCIRMRVDSDSKIDITVESIVWRTEDERIEGGFTKRTPVYGDFFGQDNEKEPIIVYKDKIYSDYNDAVIWYHHNPDSHYLPSLEFQKLEDLAHLGNDPLNNRNFGGCIATVGFNRISDLKMKSERAEDVHELCIGVLTEQTENEEAFIKNLYDLTFACTAIDYGYAYKKHIEYWREFNDKSYINISGDYSADMVDSGYAVQRYLNACAGRGEFPIKFNGSIFVPNILEGDEDLGPDFRRWGGGYWFQNTRLIYWSMLDSGDYDLMKPFFDMYEKVFDLSSAKVKKHLGFDGVLYPETMSMWGTARNLCYSRYRGDLNPALTGNYYVRYYFSGMLELITIMIEYVKHTEDKEFKENVLLKHAEAVINFYKNFYTDIDENGKIIIYPSQALENWQDARNPMDAVAGLRYVVGELVKMGTADEKIIIEWKRFYKKLPELPMFNPGGHPEWNKPCMLKPAEWYDKLGNVENPELYAIFPYRLVAFDNENNRVGIETFRRRSLRMNWGWTQDGIQAAVLALPEEAQQVVIDKFSNWNEKCRFQGYWGPNFDWVADQCNGCSAMITVQKMLIQCVDGKIYLFPAWPAEWDVEFKLHAHGNTIVECGYNAGEIKYIRTTPESRSVDVEVCFNRQTHSLY
jgi:hypothetical protein